MHAANYLKHICEQYHFIILNMIVGNDKEHLVGYNSIFISSFLVIFYLVSITVGPYSYFNAQVHVKHSILTITLL